MRTQSKVEILGTQGMRREVRMADPLAVTTSGEKTRGSRQVGSGVGRCPAKRLK